jgi:mutator protein MutT
MRHIQSAGIVLFKEKEGKRIYLLLHYLSGHWDFPKGKIEAGESKKEAVLRELQEETGLEAEIFEGFEQTLSYVFKQEGKQVQKTVYFFVGRTTSDVVNLSHEHIGYKWLGYQQAVAILTYQNAQEILRAAEQYINTMHI